MNINSKISGISSKLASVAKFARSRTVFAAAIAATSLGLAASSFGAYSSVTSITTSNTFGTPTTVPGVSGAGASYSIYNHSTYTYTMSYLGQDDAITNLSAGALGTYKVLPSAGVVTADAVTNSATNNLVIWEAGTGTGANHSTVTLDGPAQSSFSSAFNSNNVLVGADNVFSNMGNAVGNNTNVRRIDVLFTGGITASSSYAFSVFDRGPTTDHDSFYIAAITAESGGVPTAYGALIPFGDGTWGQNSITPPGMTTEEILRKNQNSAANPFQPSDSTAQTIGGELIQTNSLVAAGTKIYGYSLFSGDTPSTDSGAALVNWQNLPAADSTSTGGGLDPVATLGNLYYQTSSVPEPTTGALLLMGVGGIIARRPKRKADAAVAGN
jgi:hypothetical protein